LNIQDRFDDLFFSVVVINEALHFFFIFSLLGNADSSTAAAAASSSSVTADSVRTYLGEHPEFLDSYIEQHIPSNTIEQWISKRSGKSSSIPITIVTSSTSKEMTMRTHRPGNERRQSILASSIYERIYDSLECLTIFSSLQIEFDRSTKSISSTTTKSMTKVKKPSFSSHRSFLLGLV
jgi:hypothetical protein